MVQFVKLVLGFGILAAFLAVLIHNPQDSREAAVQDSREAAVRESGTEVDAQLLGGRFFRDPNCKSGVLVGRPSNSACARGFKLFVSWKDQRGNVLYGAIDVSKDFAERITRDANELQPGQLVLTKQSARVKYRYVGPRYELSVVADAKSFGFGCDSEKDCGPNQP